MSKITKGAVIALILKYIGGKMILPSFKVSLDGSNPLKQIGGLGGFGGIAGLKSLNSVLNGTPITNVIGDIYKNPIASISTNTLSSITSCSSSLTALASGETPLVDPTKITQLTGSLGGLSNKITSLQTLTNNISGVSLPNYENNEFGFDEVISVANMSDSIKSQVTDDMDSSIGGIKTTLTSTMDSIIAPLNSSTRLQQINDSINQINTNLVAAAGTPGFDALHAESLSMIESYDTEIDTLLNNSINSMTRVTNGVTATTNVATISGVVNGDSNTSKQFIQQVINPSKLQEITSTS